MYLAGPDDMLEGSTTAKKMMGGGIKKNKGLVGGWVCQQMTTTKAGPAELTKLHGTPGTHGCGCPDTWTCLDIDAGLARRLVDNEAPAT